MPNRYLGQNLQKSSKIERKKIRFFEEISQKKDTFGQK